MSQAENPFAIGESDERQAIKLGTIKLLLIGFGSLLAVCCGLGMVGLVYIGTVAPNTWVYAGNQVPEKYVDRARQLGALEQTEQPKYFYSDGLLRIEEGFYLVTETKVAIYIGEASPPLTVIPLNEIKTAELMRDESTLGDSYIAIQTKNGDYHAFPVSSEFDRDQLFFKEIQMKTEPTENALP